MAGPSLEGDLLGISWRYLHRRRERDVGWEMWVEMLAVATLLALALR